MEVFLKGASFHGVMLDNIFTAPIDMRRSLYNLMCEGLKSGAVQPLTRIVFPAKEVEQAFRFMTNGKHIGKMLVQIRPEEEEKAVIPSTILMQAQPRFICKPECTYVIAGGLGGFGLELADWLVLRGARKLVLTSRSGLRTGYQSYRVRIWRSYGITVNISLADITSEEGVTTLLSEANKLGPVDAIFNLAVVLQDSLLSNQTEARFAASAGPKALATRLLDKFSRQLCPLLQKFVVFSSVSCGRGNAGQANYGMSNSVMERVCEARVRGGLPGLAVQWGAVGDVGLVAEMHGDHKELVIGGTLQQRISSCLEVLDVLLAQTHPVVGSMVVAEKRAGSGNYADIMECVSSILGIRDLKTVSHTTTLAELGMDSMTAVEIKQTLEREFEVLLTAQEIRSLTFGHLEKIAANRKQAKSAREQEAQVDGGQVAQLVEQLATGWKVRGSQLYDEIKQLNSWDEKMKQSFAFMKTRQYSMEHLKAAGTSIYLRTIAMLSYEWLHSEHIRSQTTLLRPQVLSFAMKDDYELSKYCEEKVDIHFLHANHATILENEDTAAVINRKLASNRPDLAPNDFHLFLHHKKFLGGQRFDGDDEVKTAVQEWFA
ncbi:hypothetical protein ANN_00084 [Periplaneta americana]|uniref:Carrier domain-containing protein n=1 Tax=Periplaneta americana TaxID=6978 RepID=A0ABQ8TQ31_PERAM|nr:hypothetical protein ANN_00084 [Periplaneta americana]